MNRERSVTDVPQSTLLQPSSAADAQVAVPLLLAVTGPRAIDKTWVEPINNALRAVFAELRHQYPHTPLVLLSPLATEADRLAAEVTVEPQVGATFVAVLPWARSLGIDDDERCNESCVGLLTRAKQVVEIPLADGVSVDGLARNRQERGRQYDEAGRYLARHSQILLAIWDGVDRPDSNTAKVVQWHRQGTQSPFTARVGALDTSSGAAVCELLIPSSGSDAAPVRIGTRWSFPHYEAKPFVRKKPKTRWQRAVNALRLGLVNVHHWLEAAFGRTHGGQAASEQMLRNRWRAIDDFNCDAARLSTRTEELARCRGYLLPAETAQRLGPCVNHILDVYARADVGALDYQARTGRTVLWLFAAAAVAVTSLEVYAHLWHEWYVLLAYLLALGGGFAWFRWARRHEHQGRWLDLRALAEAIRVQIFWQTIGLGDCTADHYLRHFRGELDWIRHAVRAVFLNSGGHAAVRLDSDGLAERLQLVREKWVVDQRDYFLRSAPQNVESEVVFETAAKLAFFAAILVTIIHVALHLTTHHMSHVLVLGTFGCLVLAALLEEYADIKAYALLGRKYQWMADLYANAEQRVAELMKSDALREDASAQQLSGENLQRAREILFELGLEALAENADWVVQHRQRQPVLPKG